MASEIRANTIKNRVGLSTINITDTGIVVSGISTFSGVTNFNSNISVSGNLNVAQNIIHTGDTDTKIEFLNNNICFDTAGGERVRITSGGNIGVGTVSPTDPLHVYHASDNFVGRFESGDAGGGIVLKDPTHSTTLITNDGDFTLNVDNGGDVTGETIKFEMSGSEKVRINSTGGVGIGTATIAANKKLDVCDGIISMQAGHTHDTRIEFFRKNTGALGWVGIPNWSAASLYIYGPTATSNEIAAAYGGGAWNFYTGGVTSPRVAITSTGNFACGTQVDAGNTLRYFDVGNYNTGSNAGVVERLLTTKSDGTGAAGLDIVKYKAGGAFLINYETIGSNGYITFSTGENAGSPIERLRIHGSGAVTKPYQYVFTVSTNGTSKSANWSKITGLAPVAAQCTGVSDGTYWSNTNQQFTAPVTGVYHFFVGGWTSPSSNGTRYAYSFRHTNGNNLTFIGGGDYCTGDSPMVGWSRTIKLSAGEWVELWGYSAITATWGGGHHFFWGGYLLG